jgi:thioredoxin 2
MTLHSFATCPRCGAFNRFREAGEGKAPVCGKCKAALPYHNGVTVVDARGLETLVRKSPIPVFVDFWATWCGPCRFFAPIFESVAEKRFGRAVFAKLNTEDSPEASQKYRITAIPTLVVFENGVEVRRQQGALPEPAFEGLVDSLV